MVKDINKERKNILEHFLKEVGGWAIIIHQNCSKQPLKQGTVPAHCA